MSNNENSNKTVYYIPAGVGFADSLAKAILTGNLPKPDHTPPCKFELPRWSILLPTRRAARALSQSFIEQGDGAARLLPRIQPLGDVDEDELDFNDANLAGQFSPDLNAISKLERQFLLLGFIQQWADENSDVPLAKTLNTSDKQNFDLAHSLAELVDAFETHGRDIDAIADLFDGEFAEHRLQLLDFLSIIQEKLPAALRHEGKVGANDQRNQLMTSYTEWLTQSEPDYPVIAAGSTGSIPTTAKLLSTIAGLKKGAVILPGLDMDMDEESWQCLQEHHPQFGMRELLCKMEIERGDVLPLPGFKQSEKTIARNWLVSEIMRPAQTTNHWRTAVTRHKAKLALATKDMTVLGLDNERAQAKTIALIMRHGLEGQQSVALITPDRTLARNVKSELGRWQIEVDDSAGEPLSKHPNAVFLQLLLDVAKSNFAPLKLKTLITHPLTRFGLHHDDVKNLSYGLEIGCLRARLPYQGLDGFVAMCEKAKSAHAESQYTHPIVKKLSDDDWEEIIAFAKTIQSALEPLAALFNETCPPGLAKIIQIHLQVAEAICAHQDGNCMLWQSDAGEQLSGIFSKILEAGNYAPAMSGYGYIDLLERLLKEAMLRPKHVRHNQLTIFGLMEARLVASDIVILGGLNENTWPMAAQNNPWLTRPQLTSAGLPVPERRIGLSAHDFSQGFCADTVFMTYTNKLGNAPAVPSRWVLRLKALLEAAGMPDICNGSAQMPWAYWASILDKPCSFAPCKQPNPKPDIHRRVTNFSATGVEKLLKDPYRHFAEKILKLSPLNPIDHQIGAAERGSLVHDVLEHFLRAYPLELPQDGQEILLKMFEQTLTKTIDDPSLCAFWQPQLKRIAQWFITNEQNIRTNHIGSKVEVDGHYDFELNLIKYSLKARADRIDILDNGDTQIIDYKTGAPPSFIETAKNFSPQLILEALIAQAGGFEGIEKASVNRLIYIKLSGGIPPGTISVSKDIGKLIDTTQNGLFELLARYQNKDQGYLAASAPARPEFDREYGYLSRWREWAHLYEEAENK